MEHNVKRSGPCPSLNPGIHNDSQKILFKRSMNPMNTLSKCVVWGQNDHKFSSPKMSDPKIIQSKSSKNHTAPLDQERQHGVGDQRGSPRQPLERRTEAAGGHLQGVAARSQSHAVGRGAEQLKSWGKVGGCCSSFVGTCWEKHVTNTCCRLLAPWTHRARPSCRRRKKTLQTWYGPKLETVNTHI